MTIKKVLLAGLSIVLVQAVCAQEGEVELNPVTVTASMNPINVLETGRNMLVIKGERFQQLPVHSIDELMRYLPGIEVQARGPMGAQSDFVIRGGTFQQVLVILDGLRINDPVTGHFSSYIPIAPAEIDRIEILKGASSAIYGSEAVGGVIHIITKTFAKQNTGDKKSAQAQVMAGQYGLLNVQAGGFIKSGNTAIAGGLLTNHASGQPQRGTKGFLDVSTASLSLSQQLTDAWQLAFRSAYDNRHFSAQNYYTTFASDTAEERVKTIWNQLRLQYQKGKQTFSLSAGYKSGEDYYLYNKASIANLNKSGLWQGLATFQQHWNTTSVTTGVQAQSRTIKSNDRGNHEVAQAAGFVILHQSIGENLLINPALRLDWNERSGFEWVPQVNVSFSFQQLQLRGSAGKTIREADFTERFNNYNKPSVASGRIGNSDLAAERSFSYELGADYLLNNQLKLSATYFQRNHNDLIDYVVTPYAQMPRQTNLVAGGSYALAKNISSVNTSGIEVDAQVIKKLSAQDQLLISAGLLWLQSKSSEAQPSFYISSHAKWLANFNATYSHKWLVLSANGLYKVRQPQEVAAIHASVTKDYFVLNAKAEAFVYKKKWSLVAQADNIFDRQYSDLLGAPMPGRWLMGGFAVKF